MAKVLVVGGAGYVGGSVSAFLMDQGHEVWVLDDLSTGHRRSVLTPHFIEAKAGDRDVVEPLLKREKFDAVFHFAAKSIVSESVKFPEIYWENNVEQTRLLLDAMIAAGVKRFVFSSTAAVFGDPGDREMDESLPKNPINPYGETKLEVEKLLEEYAQKHALQSVALRYFNAAGADPKLRVGEHHDPETHLIPNVLKAALGRNQLKIFGKDYPTKDGTCVRDYIHVWDLARAHEAAMNRMIQNPGKGKFEAFNLGSEEGFTVLEVVQACRKETKQPIPAIEEPRRAGDPPRLVAKSALAKKELEFTTHADSLSFIVSTAWAWEKKQNEKRSAVFLDRDGTINIDPGYLNDPEKLELYPGVGKALARLQKSGFELVIISNQSGVARGLITRQQISRIHERLDELLARDGVKISHYELCFHHPDENCECRKPKPALILKPAARYSIDLSKSYMIGDKWSDMGCGKNAGLKSSILVLTGHGKTDEAEAKKFGPVVVADLTEATDWILSRS